MARNEPEPPFPNLISPGAVLKGEIQFDEGVIVDGEIDGTLTVKGAALIGEHAHVKGSVTATNAEIKGTVRGNIDCSGLLILTATAQVIGDLNTTLLRVEEGALYQGKVNMKKQKEQIEMIVPEEHDQA